MAQKLAVNSDTTQTIASDQKKIKESTPIMDTDESLRYMSNLLLFEVKKRLNLTSKEEEIKAAKEKNKKVRMSIGGIVIER
ncbi:hypothetical protein [Acidiluteibacter ferrifornacis]|jgi:hypothetical protein|uniref:Uncharacterized protein n=1 Tax=Acidiluteibacter ferrifornacis TaxID=2692424 RepID=A0A6N9NPE2_9FLAO|nr:hypothetical protein [Acidiluteibacter ferrifornacis]MBR9833045.1 hypothetical protein [bacterium]NBG66305.1 hypothetical protein [Acidiluteibacter ferrifornacis]